MKDLSRLIRIRKANLDEESKSLNTLLDNQDKIHHQIDALETEISTESKNVSGSVELGMAFDGYIRQALAEKKALSKQLTIIARRIQEQQDKVQRAFADMKAVEVVDSRHKEEARFSAVKREDDLLDELAAQAWQSVSA